MNFKTVPENIPQIRAVVRQYGGCYFHADGNLYETGEKDGFKSKASDDRQQYSNPDDIEAKYRVLFKNVDHVPHTVEALNKMLLDARSNEVVQSRKPEEFTHVKTFQM